MQIQLNTDRHIAGGEELRVKVEDVLTRAVERFSDRLTRLEVHIADVNSEVRSGPDDIRCTMEARMAGHRPVSVTNNAANVDLAVAGAADKLRTKLTRIVDRKQKTKGSTPYGGEPAA